jgi:hypothetical protein
VRPNNASEGNVAFRAFIGSRSEQRAKVERLLERYFISALGAKPLAISFSIILD